MANAAIPPLREYLRRHEADIAAGGDYAELRLIFRQLEGREAKATVVEGLQSGIVPTS